MFFKISGACSLGGFKFNSSCSLGASRTRTDLPQQPPLIEERVPHSSKNAREWLTNQASHTWQAASKGAAWLKSTWKPCHINIIHKTGRPSPLQQKTSTSFAAAVASATPVDLAPKFAQATLKFAHDLCAQLAAAQPNEQSFAISPVSLLAALGMCLNMIQKEKQALFIEKIGLGKLSVDEANVAIASALKALQLPESFKDGSLEIAQTLAAKPNVEFEPQLLDLLKQTYDSELIIDADLKTAVNSWVNDKTHGKIQDVLNDNKALFTLVNAVYLNLNWKKKFVKPEAGWPVQQFRTADNKTAPVSMMFQKGSYPLFESKTFSMMEVPYKAPDGRELSQVIFLPKQGYSLAQVEATMNAEMIRTCRASAQHVYGIYWDMPKVHAETSLELKKVLTAMGIPLNDLDHTKCSKEVFVDKVIHKTVVSNSEEGTQAAAVTVITAPMSCAPFTEIKKFTVDRAYAYLIMDKDTVLFRGRVSDASSLIVDP